MTDLRVSWMVVIPGSQCDFCSAPIEPASRVACLRDLTVAVDGPMVHIEIPGNWDLCATCQQALGIEQGALTVPLGRVAGHHRIVAMPAVLSRLGASTMSVAQLQRHLQYTVRGAP